LHLRLAPAAVALLALATLGLLRVVERAGADHADRLLDRFEILPLQRQQVALEIIDVAGDPRPVILDLARQLFAAAHELERRRVTATVGDDQARRLPAQADRLGRFGRGAHLDLHACALRLRPRRCRLGCLSLRHQRTARLQAACACRIAITADGLDFTGRPSNGKRASAARSASSLVIVSPTVLATTNHSCPNSTTAALSTSVSRTIE